MVHSLCICSYLLPDKSRSSKRKTSVIKNTTNPVWDEQKVYDKVSLEKLAKDRVLEVTVWDFNRGSSNDFIGGLRLGSQPTGSHKKRDYMDSMGTEVCLSVCVHPRCTYLCVCRWPTGRRCWLAVASGWSLGTR